MTNNFTKYQKIIDDFSGHVSNKNFETLFTEKCSHIPKTERFLLKMELKRLEGLCTRLIDLRGHVDGECQIFEHDGRSHYLDSIAIKVFEENIKLYGSYTFGVYEAVTNTENNFRVIYQNEKAGIKSPSPQQRVAQNVLEKTQYPAQLFRFGEYYNRVEERMNFSIALLVTIENKSIECNSSDISIQGCKFRLPSTEKIKVGKTLIIRFIGLEDDFQFGSINTFEYTVRNVKLIDNIQLVGVERVSNENNSRDGFKPFIKGFIQGNKRRYKINLDNTLSAIQARTFEQYILPKSNELPVFIGGKADHWLPKYALICQNNKNIFQYWQDEKKCSTLNCLITPERINKLKKASVLGQSLLVYSFIHKNQGKTYFYTADETQLKDEPDFITEFLGFAANKSHFSITLLTISDINKGKADSFYTLSDSITKRNQYLNLPTSDKHLTQIDELSYLIVANDITDDSLTKSYQTLAYENIDPAKLKVFGHKRLTKPFHVDELGVNYRNHRKESRFQYITSVDVTCKKIAWSAKSHNFSTSGLRIDFERGVPLKKGDIVHMSFPELQKITSIFNLKELAYEVIRIDKHKKTLNLKVYVEKHKHIGRAFFKALIEKNKDKLTPDQSASMAAGLAKPLRNIYSDCLSIPNLIVQTSGNRYKVEAIACGRENGSLLPLMRQLSDTKEHFNLYPILSHLNTTNTLMANLKKMHASDIPISTILYIAVNLDETTIEKQITTTLASDLDSQKLQNMFIRNALKTGYFLSLQLTLSKTNAPDMDYLNPELSYIGSYAIHRGKKIEKEIWSVAGVIQVIDTTKETMMRMKFST